MSGSIEIFILVRFFQGTGAAMIAGTSMAILYSAMAPKQRGKTMGSVKPKHYGTASSLVGTMRSFGMLVSMTAVTPIVSFYMGTKVVSPNTLDLFLKSLHMALMGFALLCFIGIAFSMARIKPGLKHPVQEIQR